MRRTTLAVVLLSLGVLSGCGAPTPDAATPKETQAAVIAKPGRTPDATVIVVPMTDGRQVECVWIEPMTGDGTAVCDWASARRGIVRESK